MFQTRVFAFGVFTDNAKVDILVACDETGDVLDQDNRGIDVELLPKSDIEGLMTRSLNGSVKDTLQAQLIPSQGSDRLSEKLFRVLVTSVDTGNINLLPLDWDIVGLEDRLDSFGNLGTNTVTCCNQM
jgi:hypothetical protein